MKQITLTISSRDYTITLDDDFAKSFEQDCQNLMGGRQFIEPKELLEAFVEKCYENYTTLKAIKNAASDIDDILKRE
ncbi:hypothetical protein [Campylobacter sp.]|uniref:hypothetical protein n=1 Tax=Campylobacter sp. TaxID=205 RepID=UPI003F9EC870